MAAALASMGSSAHNIANMGTEGFQRQIVQPAASPEGGVTVSMGRAASMGGDPARDVVEMLAAKNLFLANLAVFRAADTMSSSLLDLQA